MNARKAKPAADKLQTARKLAGKDIEEMSRAILGGFLRQYHQTMDMMEDATLEEMPPSERARLLAGLADALTKTTAACARLMPETDKLATALEVLELLGETVKIRYPQHLSVLTELIEPLGEAVEAKYR